MYIDICINYRKKEYDRNRKKNLKYCLEYFCFIILFCF